MVKKADRTPVGAGYGWQDWLAQRITAIIMLLFSVVFLGFFIVKGSVSYGEWKQLFSNQAMRILTLMFFVAVFYHAWIGIRDVLMDYIKPAGIQLALEVGVIVFLVGCTIWSGAILWGS